MSSQGLAVHTGVAKPHSPHNSPCEQDPTHEADSNMQVSYIVNAIYRRLRGNTLAYKPH